MPDNDDDSDLQDDREHRAKTAVYSGELRPGRRSGFTGDSLYETLARVITGEDIPDSVWEQDPEPRDGLFSLKLPARSRKPRRRKAKP